MQVSICLEACYMRTEPESFNKQSANIVTRRANPEQRPAPKLKSPMPADRPWTSFQAESPHTRDDEDNDNDADPEGVTVGRYGVPEAPNGQPLVPGKPDGCLIS